MLPDRKLSSGVELSCRHTKRRRLHFYKGMIFVLGHNWQLTRSKIQSQNARSRGILAWKSLLCSFPRISLAFDDIKGPPFE